MYSLPERCASKVGVRKAQNGLTVMPSFLQVAFFSLPGRCYSANLAKKTATCRVLPYLPPPCVPRRQRHFMPRRSPGRKRKDARLLKAFSECYCAKNPRVSALAESSASVPVPDVDPSAASQTPPETPRCSQRTPSVSIAAPLAPRARRKAPRPAGRPARPRAAASYAQNVFIFSSFAHDIMVYLRYFCVPVPGYRVQ